MFAIAPLALAFVLLGPATGPAANTEASAPDSPSLLAKAWQMVFADAGSVSQSKPTGSLTKAAALSR